MHCTAPIFWKQCVHGTGSVGQIYTRRSCWALSLPLKRPQSELLSHVALDPCFSCNAHSEKKTLYHYVYIIDRPARGVTFRSIFHFLQVKVFVKALIFLLMFFACLRVFLMSIKTIIYLEEYKNCYSMWPWHRKCTENCGRNFLGRLFRASTQPYPRRPWVL